MNDTEEDNFSLSSFGLTREPTEIEPIEPNTQTEPIIPDDADKGGKNYQIASFIEFISKNSQLFIVMGVFGAIAVYLTTLIKTDNSKYIPVVGLTVSNNFILNVGVVSALTLFIIIGIFIIWKFWYFQFKEKKSGIAILFDLYFLLLLLTLIGVVSTYILLNQLSNYNLQILLLMFVLPFLMIVIYKIKSIPKLFKYLTLQMLGGIMVICISLLIMTLFFNVNLSDRFYVPLLIAIVAVISMVILYSIAQVIIKNHKVITNVSYKQIAGSFLLILIVVVLAIIYIAAIYGLLLVVKLNIVANVLLIALLIIFFPIIINLVQLLVIAIPAVISAFVFGVIKGTESKK